MEEEDWEKIETELEAVWHKSHVEVDVLCPCCLSILKMTIDKPKRKKP